MVNCSKSSSLDSSNAHLEIQQLTVSYNGVPALESLSFSVPSGGLVAVVGPNGAGKSTLFKTLVGLQLPRSGQILIHGFPLGYHKHCVAYIPQREEIDWRFPVTVMDVVMMGRYGYTGWLKRPTHEDKQAARRSLEHMGIAELSNRSINELSGGQQQRVFLARALAQEPHILLMDEPFTGVDAPTQETTLAQLEQLHQNGITVLVSTHDLNMAAKHFEKILLLNRRLIAYGTPEEVFTPANIRQAFVNQALFMNGWMVVDECCPGHERQEAHK